MFCACSLMENVIIVLCCDKFSMPIYEVLTSAE